MHGGLVNSSTVPVSSSLGLPLRGRHSWAANGLRASHDQMLESVSPATSLFMQLVVAFPLQAVPASWVEPDGVDGVWRL